jgi:hypothetical protein
LGPLTATHRSREFPSIPSRPTASPSGTLHTVFVLADQAFGQTLALLATFLGIGVLVNVLVVYIIAQVLAERRENQERQQRLTQ